MINLFITWLDTIPPSWGVVAGALLVLVGLVVATLFAAVLYRADARQHPLHERVGPALQKFAEALTKREGGDFTNNLQWETDLNYVILIASEDCRTVYRFRIPNRYFYPPHDILHEVDFRVSIGEYTKTEITGE